VTAADRALQKTDARGCPELAAYDEDGDPSSSALNSGLRCLRRRPAALPAVAPSTEIAMQADGAQAVQKRPQVTRTSCFERISQAHPCGGSGKLDVSTVNGMPPTVAPLTMTWPCSAGGRGADGYAIGAPRFELGTSSPFSGDR
jgi:hypothetical protein